MLNHKGTKTLETERVILRKFKEEDVINMYNNWASDSDVTKYLTWTAHNSVELTKEIISMWIEKYNSEDNYNWAIELKDIGQVVGNISLVNVDNDNENCEVGYCIGKSYWNSGIVTEAFLEIIKFVFDEIGFERIGARYDVSNLASGRVMEKCNLKYEGTLRKIDRNNKGELIDCSYYSILKDEFLWLK